jgi:hypothetical protein
MPLAAPDGYCQDGRNWPIEQRRSRRAAGAILFDRAAIAQLVEHVIRNDGVGSSNLSCGTNYFIEMYNLFTITL